uniref:hypothetical protein n=1 Tax=Conchiformibius steedae TaxID=153493 RepID=UPI0026F1A1FC
MDWIREQRWFDVPTTRNLRGLANMLQSCGRYYAEDETQWWQYLPVLPEYRQHLSDYLEEMRSTQDAIIHCYWGELEENSLYLNILCNDLSHFLDKLLMAIAADGTLPPVPEIPPYPQFPKN